MSVIFQLRSATVNSCGGSVSNMEWLIGGVTFSLPWPLSWLAVRALPQTPRRKAAEGAKEIFFANAECLFRATTKNSKSPIMSAWAWRIFAALFLHDLSRIQGIFPAGAIRDAGAGGEIGKRRSAYAGFRLSGHCRKRALRLFAGIRRTR